MFGRSGSIRARRQRARRKPALPHDHCPISGLRYALRMGSAFGMSAAQSSTSPIEMREMSTPPQLEALENRGLDVGFVRLPIQAAEIVSIPLFSDRLVIAVRPQGRRESRQGLGSFSSNPFILVSRSASASLHDHIVRTWHAAGFSPRIVQEVGELFTALSFVRAGAGVALVPHSCKVMNVPRVRFIETGIPSAVWNIGIAVHRSFDSDPTVRNFVSMARREFSLALSRSSVSS
jgi:DNA-binding transcriptional LysR family regulator